MYERSLKIQSFKTLDESCCSAIDLYDATGTAYELSADSKVTLIDPYAEYVQVLKQCFDFNRLAQFLKDRPDFSILFDGMYGAGGPFARRVLVGELGISEVRTRVRICSLAHVYACSLA